MTIILKMETGFPECEHEEELDMTMDQWNSLPQQDRDEYYREMQNNYLSFYVEDADKDEDDL